MDHTEEIRSYLKVPKDENKKQRRTEKLVTYVGAKKSTESVCINHDASANALSIGIDDFSRDRHTILKITRKPSKHSHYTTSLS